MWFDIIKVDEERWKRYREQRKKELESRRRYKSARKPTPPKYKCAMCGQKLSRTGDSIYEKNIKTGLSDCKKYAEHRDSKR